MFTCVSSTPHRPDAGTPATVEKYLSTGIHSTTNCSNDFLHRVTCVSESLHFNCREKNLAQAGVLNTSIGDVLREIQSNHSMDSGFLAGVCLSQLWFLQQQISAFRV